MERRSAVDRLRVVRAHTLAAMMLSLSAHSASAAESTWNILESFGLAGVWSTTCGTEPTARNFRTIFVKGADGSALREIDYGAGYPIRLTVVESAQLISALKLKVRVRNADPNWGESNNMIHEAEMIKQTNPQTNEIVRIRYIQSVRADGKIIVKDGIIWSLGKPSYWEYKCRSAMS